MPLSCPEDTKFIQVVSDPFSAGERGSLIHPEDALSHVRQPTKLSRGPITHPGRNILVLKPSTQCLRIDVRPSPSGMNGSKCMMIASLLSFTNTFLLTYIFESWHTLEHAGHHRAVRNLSTDL